MECLASKQLGCETGSLGRQLLELQQHAATCVSLGLERSVHTAVQGILHASCSEGKSIKLLLASLEGVDRACVNRSVGA
jgi:hypothetical protein